MRGVRAAAAEGASGTAGAARLSADRQTVPAADAVRALLRRAHAPKTRALKRIWYNRLKCDRMGA